MEVFGGDVPLARLYKLIWKIILYCADGGGGVVFRTCAVNELTSEVGNGFALVEEAHTGGVGHISHVSHFYVVGGTVCLKLSTGVRFDDHSHTLLRLTDSKFSWVETAVFSWDTVEVDIEAIG